MGDEDDRSRTLIDKELGIRLRDLLPQDEGHAHQVGLLPSSPGNGTLGLSTSKSRRP